MRINNLINRSGSSTKSFFSKKNENLSKIKNQEFHKISKFRRSRFLDKKKFFLPQEIKFYKISGPQKFQKFQKT